MRFSTVIVRRRQELSDDRLVPLRFCFSHHVLSDAALLIRMIINYRSILRARVVALPVQCRRIVYHEKNFEQLTIRNLLRVELEAHNFRMTCGPVAHIGITRFGNIATRIAGLAGTYALYFFVHRFEAAETSSAYRGELGA